RNVHAIELVVFLTTLVDRLLIDERVDRYRGLAGLAVADDQLALAASDRHQRVDGLQPGLHRLLSLAARDDAWRLDLDQATLGGLDRALAVDRVAERVDHAPQQALAHRHIDDRAGALDGVAFPDAHVVAEDHDADIVALQVQRHALDAAGELDHFAGLHAVQAIDTRNAVADRQHLAHLGDFGLGAEIGDLLLENGRDFGGTDIHLSNPLHGKLQTLQLAADGRIEQARADLDDETAQDLGLDPRIDGNLGAAQDASQRVAKLLQLLRRQRHG